MGKLYGKDNFDLSWMGESWDSFTEGLDEVFYEFHDVVSIVKIKRWSEA